MKFKSFAKINLCLDVLKKDKSGYHIIQTVFHEVKDLYDEVEILNSKKDEIIINAPISSSENLAYRALKLLKKELKIKKCAKIKISKNIPISSGLGGGSSNAATVLKGLNKMWNLKLPKKKLLEMAKSLGMDVPFFIIGGTVYGENFGEKLTRLKPVKNIIFTIHSKADFTDTAKTAKKYKKLKLKNCGKFTEKTKKLLKAILLGDTKNIIKNLHSDFETIANPATKIPKNHHLSGAGPTTFTATR
ncbi:MAG: 4-(cytidine 5'-diphospho)-2-C-methyl-D-erythritol kinase [Candidatus Gracilibacteria bacterium]|nr:4-(cytidine 5'-diphospho)-2-C-methyl-D-erythritol kinase [Candidatus Gracilibacteria bacterium]